MQKAECLDTPLDSTQSWLNQSTETINESMQPMELQNQIRHHCSICNKTYSRRDTLSAHLRDVHGAIPITCKECSKVFSSHLALQRHKINHSTKRPHQCPICSSCFKRLQDLKFHEHQHENVELKCELCVDLRTFKNGTYYNKRKKTFTSHQALQKHKRTHINLNKREEKLGPQCEKCVSHIRRRLNCHTSDFRYHQALHHQLIGRDNEPLHQCTVCLETYKTCSAYKRHQHMHQCEHLFSRDNPKRIPVPILGVQCEKCLLAGRFAVQCKLCSQLLSSKAALQKHLQTIHTVSSVASSSTVTSSVVASSSAVTSSVVGSSSTVTSSVVTSSSAVTSSVVASSSAVTLSFVASSPSTSVSEHKRRDRVKRKGFKGTQQK